MVRRYCAAALFLWVQAAAGGDIVPADTVKLKPVRLKPAPVVILTMLNRQDYELEFNNSTVTLVHFWASWCTPCLQEMPGLQALQDRYRNRKLRIITIAADSHNSVRKYISKYKINLDVLIDQYGSALHAFKVKALPTTFLINKEGKINYLATGSVHWDDPKVSHTINKLLAIE